MNLWGIHCRLVALTLFTRNSLLGKTHQAQGSMVGGGLYLQGNLWPSAESELEH